MATAPPTLFRDRTAAIANTLVMTWTLCGWLGSFALMAARSPFLDGLGVLLCAHTMVLAAYLIHEAAHQTLFAVRGANCAAGEVMNFIAGSSYASFERIRHMHIRHHVDRADLTWFDFKGLMRRRPPVRRVLEVLEWAYVPATEVLMHLQVAVRPLFVRSQRRYLPRVSAMAAIRGALLVLLCSWSIGARPPGGLFAVQRGPRGSRRRR
jgi:fatty acid desaturase